MTSQLVLRRLEQNDLGKHASLFGRVFDAKPLPDFVNRKSWGWPRQGEFLIYGAFDDGGNLQGAISFFPRIFARKEETALCVEAGDVMVSPEYRGKFLFPKLIKFSFAELGKQGVAVVYGFPNRDSYPGWRRASATFPYQIRAGLLPIAVGSVLARKRRLPRLVISLCDGASRSFHWLRRRSSKLVPEIADAFDEDLAALAAVAPRRFERMRTQEYFRWRYSWSGQASAFRVITLKDQGHLVAYAVVKMAGDGSIDIFELGCPDEAMLLEVVRTLVHHGVSAVEVATGQRVNRVLYTDFTGTEPVISVLRSCGFIFRETPFHLMMHAIDPNYARLLNSSEWHITPSDTDWS